MALIYDFDMISGHRTATHDGPGPDGSPGNTGPVRDATPAQMALFRDAATVAALARAPRAVQDYLQAARFGTDTHHSGAPQGRYPAADEAARIAVIQALTEHVGRFDLPVADDAQPGDGEFHLPSFFAAVIEAEPMPPEAVAACEPDISGPDLQADPALAPDVTALDMAIFDTVLADAATSESAMTEPAMTDTRQAETLLSKLVLSETMMSDALLADMMRADAAPDDVAPTAVQMPAPDAPDMTDGFMALDHDGPPDLPEPHMIPPRARFHLMQVPRWLVAGGAVAVLGALVGTAMI